MFVLNKDSIYLHGAGVSVDSARGLSTFSIWAPKAKTVEIELVEYEDGSFKTHANHMMSLADDVGLDDLFTVTCQANEGTLYRYRINGGDPRPDPRSHFQPFGVHGPSQVIDTRSFDWNDQNWKGVNKRDLVIYEMHLGSFTEQGTYEAAIERLPELRAFGFTAIEVLPLAQCPGKWNWGYDGVNYYAPNCNFGSPKALKDFVDACHANGLAVINDVVYNHVGPEGNYLSEFGPYRAKKGTPWGDAFNFDERHVRDFVIDNVLYWLDEFHFDGLRLDAVHYMFDNQPTHITHEIQQVFKRYQSRVDRRLHLIGESNIYDPELVGTKDGTSDYDAIWSDCLMHSIYKKGAPELRLTNRHYEVTDIAETVEHGYVFSAPQAIRVTPELREQHHPDNDRNYIQSLIMALQTHDSVGNHPHGKRIHQLMSKEYQRAAAPLILLYPSIPMIFMGEEWATDAPFPFFADFEDQGLRDAVDQGRRDEYPHHDWEGSPLPSDPQAFLNSKSSVDQQCQSMHNWYRQLLNLRHEGIRAGWLGIENFDTSTDLKNGLFQLVFALEDGAIKVCCRLERDDCQPIPFTELELNEIILDSKSCGSELLAEHAVIGRC